MRSRPRSGCAWPSCSACLRPPGARRSVASSSSSQRRLRRRRRPRSCSRRCAARAAPRGSHQTNGRRSRPSSRGRICRRRRPTSPSGPGWPRRLASSLLPSTPKRRSRRGLRGSRGQPRACASFSPVKWYSTTWECNRQGPATACPTTRCSRTSRGAPSGKRASCAFTSQPSSRWLALACLHPWGPHPSPRLASSRRGCRRCTPCTSSRFSFC
mmetsp:Transcript_4100/g.9180  ORF Transcript_4100/g.9180 Transcript_4100/m.9180 type:complete len:213 (-) Transcript_4100:1732-2370(-)